MNTSLKRGLLLASLVMALTACDNNDNNVKVAPASSDSAPTAAPANAQPAPEKESAPQQVSPDAVLGQKMDAYIGCYNSIDSSIHRSLERYASWVKDMKAGPDGKERIVYGLYQVRPGSISDCKTSIDKAVALKPEAAEIDPIARDYIDSAAAVADVINDLNQYYEQEDYKDDAFAKGKAQHPQLVAAYKKFDAASDAFSEAIENINDARQVQQLKALEQSEGKTPNYYTLAIMLHAKAVERLIEKDDFAADEAMGLVQQLQSDLQQLGTIKDQPQYQQAYGGGRLSSFIDRGDDFAKAAKQRIRRVRDHVAYTDSEKRLIENTGSSWMVEGSVGKMLKEYNSLVAGYNAL